MHEPARGLRRRRWSPWRWRAGALARLRRRRHGRRRRQRRRGDGGRRRAVAATLTISNWPRLHRPGKTDRRRVRKGDRRRVNYIEDVNDNNEFFAKMQPQLEQGESGGRSIFVVTDWMAKQMYDLGYLQKIDHGDLPNVVENLVAEPARPRLRPGPQVLACRGRAGMTGIWSTPRRRRRSTRSATSSTPSTRARSTCSNECATRCRW